MKPIPGPLAALVALAPLGGGCAVFHRNPPAPPPVIVNQAPIVLEMPPVNPILPEPPPLPPAPPPETTPAPAPAPTSSADKPLPRPPPPSSRAGDRSAATPVPADDGPAPQLAISLTPAQQDQYRRNIQSWLTEAQHDLDTLAHRGLDAAGTATRAQANDYVRQSMLARNQGDLVRAANLAQKALTLARSLLQ